MIDVIDPIAAPAKYGDTAESSEGHVATMVTTGASTPPSGRDRSARTTRIGVSGSVDLVATVTAISAGPSALNARGRAVTFYEDDEVDVDDNNYQEDEEDSYYQEEDEDDKDQEAQPQKQPPCLEASLLDYVMSEVANRQQQQQMMDLEHSSSNSAPAVSAPPRPNRRKYAFNPEEPQDEPPHLCEYYEKNVIAVLTRCDPLIWGRCYSCGTGDTAPQQLEEEQDVEQENDNAGGTVGLAFPYRRVSSGEVITTHHGPRSVYEVDTFWNYYNNYKNEYRTFGVGGGNSSNQQSGYQYQSSEPTSPWMMSGGGGGPTSPQVQQQQHFFGMDVSHLERMRYNSDGGNTTTSSDLDTNPNSSSAGTSSSNHGSNCHGNAAAAPGSGAVEMEEGEEVFTFDARLLSESFLSSGRVDHSIQLMAYHPDYLEIFLRTHNFLMKGDGPLPYNFRNYIAIMAAGRYRCNYLMEIQKREFLYQGGDPNWLRGLDAAPPKLVALYNINKVMAHRPWVLKKEDLQYLTKKAGWSLSEVVQAVVLLAHFHSISSFIHGCGITPEVDFDNGHTFLMDPTTAPVAAIAAGGGGGAAGAVVAGQQIEQQMDTKLTASLHHGQVSFAVGPPSIVTTTNTLAGGSGITSTSPLAATAKKSILKKTENNLSTSPASSSSSTSSVGSSTNGNGAAAVAAQGGGGAQAGNVGSSNSTSSGINVPSSVHFHPYHHHHHHNHHHHHSHHQSPCGSLTSSPILKSDALHNSQCGGGGASVGGNGSSPPRAGSTVSEVDIIMATMKNLSETSPIEDPEERKKRFETVARSDLDTNLIIADPNQKENMLHHHHHPHHQPSPGNIISVTGAKSVGIGPYFHTPHRSMLSPDVTPFISEPDFTYEDFAKRGQVSELHTFRIQDYSWEEHGFSLVNRLYAEVGQILDDKFKVAQSMTYYTIGGRANVDTTKFRTAVWNYIQCLYGIRHDDYDYGEVNQLLERPLKAFIKTVCCYPERITKADYDNVMREFKHSEKVHVNLMIMEAKLQAELLYALRTVMKLMF